MNKRISFKSWKECWLQNYLLTCLKMAPTVVMKLKDQKSKVSIHHEIIITKAIQYMMGLSIFPCYTWALEHKGTWGIELRYQEAQTFFNQSIIPKLSDEQFKQKIRMSIPCFERILESIQTHSIFYNNYVMEQVSPKKGGMTCFKHPLLESRSAY